MKIGGALLAYLVATILWFYGEAFFIKEIGRGNILRGWLWILTNVVAVPLFAIGTLWLFQIKREWWAAEFPYWGMSIIISYIAFTSVLKVKIGWQEIVSVLLLLVIACLLGTKTGQ